MFNRAIIIKRPTSPHFKHVAMLPWEILMSESVKSITPFRCTKYFLSSQVIAAGIGVLSDPCVFPHSLEMIFFVLKFNEKRNINNFENVHLKCRPYPWIPVSFPIAQNFHHSPAQMVKFRWLSNQVRREGGGARGTCPPLKFPC